MPLYAYRCTQCGYRFEKIQNFNSAQELVCPKCQGVLERPLTAPRLHFKGAGWYVNDYAAKTSDSASESGAESGPGAVSESGNGAASSETKEPSAASESNANAPADVPAPSTTPSSSAPASTP